MSDDYPTNLPNDERPLCPRILIVDDDPDHCRLLSDSLTLYYRLGSDSRILCLTTGRKTLEQKLTDYDAVLLDLNLPDINGLEVLTEILARADVPVIFVTGEQDLAVATKAIEQGAQDYIVKHGDYLFAIPTVVQKNIRLHKIKLENQRLQMQMEWMLAELQTKNEQLQSSMARLEELATTDPLTGLFNRRTISEQLHRQFSEAQRYDVDLCCCMIDMDHYKQFNDTLGHQMGDELLKVMAEEIRNTVRASDIAGRYGGDEFILLLPQTSWSEAEQLVERLRVALADRMRADKRMTVPVTLSIGVASRLSETPNSDDELVRCADRALYAAKQAGRNRTVASHQMAETL